LGLKEEQWIFDQHKFGRSLLERDKFLRIVLKINTHLELKIPEGDFAGVYRSLVEDVIPEGIVIAGPMYKGELVPMSADVPVTVSARNSSGLYEFQARVLKVRPHPVYLVDLEIPLAKKVAHIQRRQFVRLNHHLRVAFQVPADRALGTPRRKIRTLTRNVCGNGLCLTHREPLDIGRSLYFQIPFFPERPDIEVMGEIIRCDVPKDSRKGNLFDIGVNFSEIRLHDQDRICKFIFDEERQRIRELFELS